MPFLEDYTLLDELGKGGYATVYKVRHNRLGYVRAVRVLKDFVTKGEDDPIYKKFEAECRVLLRLGNGIHPNIVRIYRPYLKDMKAFVEMDYVDGMDMAHFLKERNNFIETDEVMNLLVQISSALAYCHEDIYKFCMNSDEDNLKTDPNDGSKVLIDDKTKKHLKEKYRVVHNDIHHGNIMRRENGTYVLLDFGLAIEGDEVVRSSRFQNGVPEFMAPEKWDSESITTQSDIYSFGILLYECLAGRTPFVCDANMYSRDAARFRLREDHINSTPEPIFALRKAAFENSHKGQTYTKDYPDWLEQLIMKCLAKEPSERFANGKELHDFIVKQLGNENGGNLKNANEQITLLKENKELNGRIQKLKKDNDQLQQENKDLRNKNGVDKPVFYSVLVALLIVCAVGFILYFSKCGEYKQLKYEVSVVDSVSVMDEEISIDVNGVSVDMVLVEGGTFQMGSNIGDNDEKPVHSVTLDGYYIGKYEVTQALWKAVMGTTVSEQRDKAGYSDLYGVGDNYPMYYISWEECDMFVQRLSYLTGKNFSLPTEAQWEYAARGGNKSKGYTYSGGNVMDYLAWYDGNSGDKTHPVGRLQPNELGIYDMSGNVSEWCSDWYDSGYYYKSPSRNPVNTSAASCRVRRGGGWYFDAERCRVADRDSYRPTHRGYLGVRLVLLP